MAWQSMPEDTLAWHGRSRTQALPFMPTIIAATAGLAQIKISLAFLLREMAGGCAWMTCGCSIVISLLKIREYRSCSLVTRWAPPWQSNSWLSMVMFWPAWCSQAPADSQQCLQSQVG